MHAKISYENEICVTIDKIDDVIELKLKNKKSVNFWSEVPIKRMMFMY